MLNLFLFHGFGGVDYFRAPNLFTHDELMNDLDKDSVKDLQQDLLGMKAKGKTMLIASHSAGDIDILCDTVCKKENGALMTVK